MRVKGRASRLFGFLALPLAISQWTPVPIGSQRLPEIKATDAEWDIKTEGDAGGFAYLLPAQTESSPNPARLSWLWRVAAFPKTPLKIPFEKIPTIMRFVLEPSFPITRKELQFRARSKSSKVLPMALANYVWICKAKGPAWEDFVGDVVGGLAQIVRESNISTAEGGMPVSDRLLVRIHTASLAYHLHRHYDAKGEQIPLV